jgi:hypothetical protein
VGTADIGIVNVGAALAARHHPIELLDEWSQDLVNIGEAIFDRDGEYSEELRDWLEGSPLIGDLLIADRITLDPRFRGHGLGPLIAGLAIASLGRGCALAACIPAPICCASLRMKASRLCGRAGTVDTSQGCPRSCATPPCAASAQSARASGSRLAPGSLRRARRPLTVKRW